MTKFITRQQAVLTIEWLLFFMVVMLAIFGGSGR